MVDTNISGDAYRLLDLLMRVVALAMAFETRWVYPEHARSHLGELLQAENAKSGSFLSVLIGGDDVQGRPIRLASLQRHFAGATGGRQVIA